MKRLFVSLVLMMSLAVAHAADHAHGMHAVKVDSPFVRLMPPTQPNTGAFMVLENTGKKDLNLVSAESDVSKVVELHDHVMVDGMMRMREVEKIAIPAGKRAELKPGSLHVMLIGLHKPLQDGQMVDITLIFDDGSRQDIQAPVRHPGGEMMPMHGHKH